MNIRAVAFVIAISFAAPAFADHRDVTYEITVTNITPGQIFTPILAATHRSRIQFFEVGEPALPELAVLAESGNTAPLTEFLSSAPDLVFDTHDTEAVLGPGESVRFEIEANRRYNRLSFAAMLIPTNDTFVGANSVKLPRHRKTFTVSAYDAGSEVDDENCDNIPGPPPVCTGEGTSSSDGEGFVHIGNGIHGIGSLDPAVYDWRNPVASVTIKRVY